jgi:hypothetical protein
MDAASRLRAHLTSVTFSNGLSINLNERSTVVIVGPNNSGKTTALSDIVSHLSTEHGPEKVIIKSVELHRDTPIETVKEFLSIYKTEYGSYSVPGYSFHEPNVDQWWTGSTPHLAGLAHFVLSFLTTRARLTDCNPAPAFDVRAKGLDLHPIQAMYRDDKLEERISNLFRSAFRQDLIVHKAAGGTNIPLYVGIRPTLHPGENPTSLSYIERLEQLGPLEKQGDGMVSFASLILRVHTHNRSIQLIDEPEAFLHPPQERLVAGMISSDSNQQTFIATHSGDIVKGLLESHPERVSFVRLQRNGNETVASHLPQEQIAELWKDPILRYSNVLEGLFHEGVVVAEADADCRFYDAIAAGINDPEETADLFYTYSGGKHRIPVVVKALRALSVPVRTVVDFDVLNNERPLKDIIEAHGGVWTSFEPDWAQLKNAIESSKNYLNGDRFAREVSNLINGIEGSKAVPKDVISKIRDACTQASPWTEAKKRGIAGVPSGEPTRRATALLTSLRSIGIFVIPEGEMEGFCRSVGGKGPRWVEEVLKRDPATDAELKAAVEFARSIHKSVRTETFPTSGEISKS